MTRSASGFRACWPVACSMVAALFSSFPVSACDDLSALVVPHTHEMVDEIVLRRVAAEAGCALQERSVQGLTIARRLQMLRNGEYTVTGAATRTEERMTWARFSLPYRQDVVRVYAHPELPASQWPDSVLALSVTSKRVAVVRKAAYGPLYAELIAMLGVRDRLWEASSSQAAMSTFLVSPPRAHFLVVDEHGGQRAARAAGVNLQATGLVLDSWPIHFMYAEKVSEDTRTRMDAAIERLHKSGRLRQLLAATGFGGLAWPETVDLQRLPQAAPALTPTTHP